MKPFQEEFIVVKVKNGVGMESDAKFTVLNHTKRKILDLKIDGFIESGKDSLETLKSKLESMAYIGVYALSLEVNNRPSFEFYGIGSVFVSGNKLTISIPYRAQNGYGNYVIAESFYILKWNETTKSFDGEIL